MELSQDIEELITTRLLAQADVDMPAKRRQLKRTEPEAEARAMLITPDFIKVEKNLSSLGFFTPSSKKIKNAKAKTISFTRVIEGKRVEATVTIAPAALYGLPVTSDEDKYFAFQKLVGDALLERGEVKNPIGFTSAELLRLQGKRVRTGKNYQDISDWLDVMTSTTIVSEGAVYFAGKKTFARDRFHVFERAVSFGKELPDGSIADRNYVWLSEWQLENINNKYLLPVDYETYKRLKNHISKALVPLLQIWLYATKDEGMFEKRYEELCQHLNIRLYQHLSKIKEKLGPALDELAGHGYLASWKVEKTSDGKGYKVILFHGEKFYQDRRKRIGQREQGTAPGAVKQLPDSGQSEDGSPTVQETQPTALSVTTGEDEQLVRQLIVDFGVTAAKAFELMSTKRDAVAAQLEAWPYRNVSPQNRAGWIIEAIEQNFSPPAAYREEQQRRQERELSARREAAVAACSYCDPSGFRFVKSERYPTGAAKKCTHDPAVEKQYDSAR